jgi:hypothetical protein
MNIIATVLYIRSKHLSSRGNTILLLLSDLNFLFLNKMIRCPILLFHNIHSSQTSANTQHILKESNTWRDKPKDLKKSWKIFINGNFHYLRKVLSVVGSTGKLLSGRHGCTG